MESQTLSTFYLTVVFVDLIISTTGTQSCTIITYPLVRETFSICARSWRFSGVNGR